MSASVERDGVWEIRTWDEHPGIEAKRLVRCPLCPYRFAEGESRADHFFEEHGPEDAGLSALSADHDGQCSLASFGGGEE